jgi:hypothetical protein
MFVKNVTFICRATVLRLHQEVLWIVGLTVHGASHSLFTVVFPLQPSLVCVNQPKVHVTSEGITWFSLPVFMRTEFGKHNSVRKMWRASVHGHSFHSLITVTFFVP